MISDWRTTELRIRPSRIQSCERAMPSWVLATTKAGSVSAADRSGTIASGVDPRRQHSHHGRPAAARPAEDTAKRHPAAAWTESRAAARALPRVRYSGMIFCADAEMPKSIMLPSSSTQVQT